MKLEEIAHKKKTVAALIRYINNTVNSMNKITPNFSVLLGAGASVTSGISSGQNLTQEWKEEIWREDKDRDLYKDSEEYFNQAKLSWYDPTNAYSSLFENRYELQRHRRMFVERQVAEKKPSIGYAYLVKLIENGFFNTIFTTNFDDLLNESFYRYSNLRPIVCAHDSSISGVTITSSRPKIIKLHGDYLYENIKTTLRETNSLESNMRMKFQEFAKDFGLIVVGYSGQDHSIMDILKYLVSKEEYFKNGIFWCVRKADKEKLSPELSKLLWMDKVFFVEIDGFDELFAELNKTLNDGKLPIDDDFLNRNHQKSIINELADNSLLVSSPSEILKDDCIRLKHQFEENMTSDFLSFIREKQSNHFTEKNKSNHTKRRSKFASKTKEETLFIQELVNEAFVIEHKNSVKQKLEAIDVFNLPDSQYKLELLELKADIFDTLSDDEIKKYFEELIRLDQDNQRYYEIAANRSISNHQSLYFIEKAVEQFPNDYYIYSQQAKLIYSICKNSPLSPSFEELCKKGIAAAEKSLLLYSGVSNVARCVLIDLYELLYKNQRDKIKDKAKDLYVQSKNLDKYHLNTLILFNKSEGDKYNESIILESINFYKSADDVDSLESVYIEYIKWLSENCIDDPKILRIFDEFELKYVPSNRYLLAKSKWLIEREYFDDALKLLLSLPSSIERDSKLLSLYGMLGDENALDEFFTKSKYQSELMEYYYESKNDFEELANYYSLHESDIDFLTEERVIKYSYALLKIKKYDIAEKLLHPYYSNPKFVSGPIIVNYLFARKKQGIDVKKQINSKIIENKYISYSDYELLGAYCVLGEEQKALTSLSKIISKSPREKYIIEDWPIMQEFVKKEKFSKYLKHSPKQIPQ